MQSNFFDRENTADQTQQSAPGQQQAAIKRRFLYDGQIFEDPGPTYTVQDVLTFLSATYPELANGTWTTRTVPYGVDGNVEEVTFVKVTGEKGNDTAGGSGVNLLDQPPDRPLLPGPVGQAKQRVFIYDNQQFEDPGAEYEVQDVLNFLSSTYPELSNGTWTSRTSADGSEEITFVKVTGEKGGS